MVLQWQCQVIVVIKFLSNVYSIDYSTILTSIDIIMILISISSLILLLFRTILNRLIFHFTCLNKFSKFRLLFSSNQFFFDCSKTFYLANKQRGHRWTTQFVNLILWILEILWNQFGFFVFEKAYIYILNDMLTHVLYPLVCLVI